MPLEFVRNDIVRMRVDAIVNPTNRHAFGTSGVDGAIRQAAGPEMNEACRRIEPLVPGEAKITPGFNLAARWVIHTVGPVWRGGVNDEQAILNRCYTNCLRAAREAGCESVAFPLISSGSYGYPRQEALDTAISAIRAFLEEEDMLVYLVVYDSESFAVSRDMIADIRAFITDRDIPSHVLARNRPMPSGSAPRQADAMPAARQARPESFEDAFDAPVMSEKSMAEESMDLEAFLRQQDEGFRDMLLRKIDEAGISDAECYKRANVDRKLFNKIKNNPEYRPGKPTVTAFVIALRLPLGQAREMLEKAGYSLNRASRFDLIIEYFITREMYDIDRINQALFSFDQSLLGSGMSA